MAIAPLDAAQDTARMRPRRESHMALPCEIRAATAPLGPEPPQWHARHRPGSNAIGAGHVIFGVTCRRWNIGLADGGTQRLPRIVGWRRAMELIVTGRVIDAAEALEIGLVNEVVPSGTCLERALELAEEIAALPQPAIRTDLEAAERGWGRPLEEGLRIEAECFNRLLGEPEIVEGVRRFNERDHPDRK